MTPGKAWVGPSIGGGQKDRITETTSTKSTNTHRAVHQWQPKRKTSKMITTTSTKDQNTQRTRDSTYAWEEVFDASSVTPPWTVTKGVSGLESSTLILPYKHPSAAL